MPLTAAFFLFSLQLREKAAGEDKSKMPAELREKKTRAMRRRLTAAQVRETPLFGPATC
jgi:hypothetical protein